MKNNNKKNLKKQNRRKERNRLISILAAVVVFVTSYSLVLPAITMDAETAAAEPGIETALPAAEPITAESVVLDPVPVESAEPAVIDPVPVESAEPAVIDPVPVEPVEPAAEEPVPQEPTAEEPAPQEQPAVEEPASQEPAVQPADETADPAAEDVVEIPDENTPMAAPEESEETDEAAAGEENEAPVFMTGPFIYDTAEYLVTVSFGAEAQIPEGTTLTWREFVPGSNEYSIYYPVVCQGMAENGAENPEASISALRVFALNFTDKNGADIRPAAPVDILVSYKQPTNPVENEKLYGVTFRADDGQPARAALLERNARDTSACVEAAGGVIQNLHILDLAANDYHTNMVIAQLAWKQDSQITEEAFSDETAEDQENTPAEVPEEGQENDTAEVPEEDQENDQAEVPEEDQENDQAEVSAEEEVTILTRRVPVTGAAYTLNLQYGSDAGIPEDAVFVAVPIAETHADYEEYKDRALNAVDIQAEGTPTLLGLFDLTIYDAEGNVIEPLTPITVTASLGDALQEADDVYAVHFIDSSAVPAPEQIAAGEVAPAAEAPIEVIEAESDGTEATFETDSLSVIALVGTTIEKTVLASDGENYKITVTYGEDAGVPEGAELEAAEILPGEEASDLAFEYETYLEKTKEALGLESGVFEYARFFDIKIVNENGEKVQITAPVDVKIELADKENGEETGNSIQVVHFADGSESGEIVEITTESAAEGQAVMFEAKGFSAYAIVEGPKDVPDGWHRIGSVEELISRGNSGLYIGHVDGFFFTGEQININNSTRTGIKKTKPAESYPGTNAVVYYFEKVGETNNQFKVYCGQNDNKKYIAQSGNSLSLTTENLATSFTIDQFPGLANTFRAKGSNGYYWNMQAGEKGDAFAAYNNATDINAKMCFWYYTDIAGDPYDLDGNSYGLMYWDSSLYGKAMMSDSGTENALDAKALMVLATADNKKQLFVPNDSDISMWTFHWVKEDKYYLTVEADGITKYLKIGSDGVSLVNSENEASQIQVIPGTGSHAGQICLRSEGTTLTYSGSIETGFSVGGSVGTEWLNLVELSELTSDYYKTYSASKVSVSDTNITTGSKVIVYTRVWNEKTLQYEYYAIGHDGTLVRCYESGDSIEWVGSVINTMLWQFTEYTEEDGVTPSYYYELFNEYAEKYLAPQVTDGQIVADDPIGINMNGRRYGQYYSNILAWDEHNYSYAGLKVENGQIVSCPKLEAMDFYFAVMKDIPVDDKLTTVNTVDHAQYGITMKVVDFNGTVINGTGCTTTAEQDAVMGYSYFSQSTQYQPTSGLLSTDLGSNGYPTATRTNTSLEQLFANNAREVNHLFIQSTYNATGYYEYDSSQNFASLNPDNWFTVYKQLGTYDGQNKNTLQHGQFLPFNDIEAGRFASVNKQNLYSTTGAALPDGDPRKYENLYLVTDPNAADLYFGVELKASFTQTPSGLDDWGHDIIFEFTGDDDFWLYVDGELVIDLGGIHSALPGKVNFKTGVVNVNGIDTTLRELFTSNFITRYKQEHGGAEPSDAAVEEFLAQYFDDESTVFRDYSTHTMNIFYMERGGGASNLHMRFNLASVKPGTVELSKTLDGVDASESTLAEFAYQIKYKKKNDNREYYLTNQQDGTSNLTDYVFYKNTTNPVIYEESKTIGGNEYHDVFILKPGETVVINFPSFDDDEIDSYSIVECGVNTEVFNSVTVNNNKEPVSDTGGEGYAENRKDYGIGYASTKDRPRVNYVNTVNPDALRTLTFRKKLYDADGETEISNSEDSTMFNFRLYFGTESDTDLVGANMYTYHVLDPEGYYCKWDASLQSFVKIDDGSGNGINNYTLLSDEQKTAASFSTSMNGAISRIPVDYTVEVRQILAGTKYKVQERPGEIPDGYSFQKYVYYDNYSNDSSATATETYTGSDSAAAGVVGTTETQKDPHVDICNLKGYGLRVYKVWTDEDYMSARDTTYFAVYTKKHNGQGSENGQGYGQLDYVHDTLRALPYGAATLYWYWLTLPVNDVNDFDDYVVREVQITKGIPEGDNNGVVTNADDLEFHWVREKDELELTGTQKGETESAKFTYTVRYEQGEPPEDSNVRVDTVTNDRPGIILKKQTWSGYALAGTTFTLTESSSGTLIGTFTSDSDGNITTAFLGEGKEYILTETSTPQGYHGLEYPLTIKAQDRTVTVNDSVAEPEDGYYVLMQAKTENGNTTPATLIIKNRPYTLQAVKQDGDTQALLKNVHFELHKQVTVGGVTSFDLNAMTGYEDLVTDENGLIPKIDNNLPAGTYQLREKTVLNGYQTLPGYIEFTVSEMGAVSLLSSMSSVDWVTLTGTTNDTDPSGTLAYTLTILNYIDASVTIKKVDNNNTALLGSKFQLCKYGSTWEVVSDYSVIDLTEVSQKTLTKLTAGRYRLTETQSPDGYVILTKHIYFTILPDGTVTFTNESGTAEISYNGTATLNTTNGNSITIINNPGTALPSTGGPGTNLIYILGSILTIGAGVLLWRRRKVAYGR